MVYGKRLWNGEERNGLVGLEEVISLVGKKQRKGSGGIEKDGAGLETGGRGKEIGGGGV